MTPSAKGKNHQEGRPRTFPFPKLTKFAIERFRDRLEEKQVTHVEIRDTLSNALNLLREIESSQSYVYVQKEICRIAGVNYWSVFSARTQRYKYKRDEKMPQAAAAVLLAVITVTEYLFNLIDNKSEMAEFFLGNVSPKDFQAMAHAIFAIRDRLSDASLPLQPASFYNLGFLGAPLLRWRYSDFDFDVYEKLNLEADGFFSEPVKKPFLQWDCINGLRDSIRVILRTGRTVAGDTHEVVVWLDEKSPVTLGPSCLDPDRGLPSAVFFGLRMPHYRERLRIQYKINGWHLREKWIPVVDVFAANQAATDQAFAEMELE